jgi:hypothetical protein
LIPANKSSEEEDLDEDGEFKSPKKRKKISHEHGTSLIEIPGTPIVNTPLNAMGTNFVDKVPDWEKFSESICPHKEFDMEGQTPTGSYKKIVKITRQLRTSPD